MKWAIIIVVILSLVGSIMWVMPTPRQRFQAQLRAKAKPMGFQVQMVRLTAPRATGEVDAEKYSVMAYRVYRHNLDKKTAGLMQSWHAFRVDAIANEGLPEGWSWGFGEGVLSEESQQLLKEVIDALPAGVSSIESTPIHITAHWDEKGSFDDLELIKTQLDRIVEAKI